MANKATALETRLKAAEGTPTLIGETPSMQAVRRLIDTIAPTDASVMILGETGTGKELIAKNLSKESHRAGYLHPRELRYVAQEPPRRGRRTSATAGRFAASTHRKGLFEVANGGTLFLDEVGELYKSVQVKLLRFLESGEIRRASRTTRSASMSASLCAQSRPA